MKKGILMKRSFALILLIGLATSLVLVGLKEQRKYQQSLEGNATLIIKSIGRTTTEKFKVVDATALELLKHRHKVELTYGKYLKCIDDVCANKEYMWNWYVNERLLSLGADDYKVKDGDKIKFEFVSKWRQSK